MFVPFETLPPESRVWIYQSNRRFSHEELRIVEDRLRQFTGEWSVHGAPLNTSFKVGYDQFIILAADESQQDASGCSIDSSVRVLKTLEQEVGVQLFDRNLVAFKRGEEVTTITLKELKQKFTDGTLNEDTLTFNNLVTTRAALDDQWLVPVRQTWLKRYIPNVLAKVG